MRRTQLFREKITSVNAFTLKSVGVPLEIDIAENVAAKFRAGLSFVLHFHLSSTMFF